MKKYETEIVVIKEECYQEIKKESNKQSDYFFRNELDKNTKYLQQRLSTFYLLSFE